MKKNLLKTLYILIIIALIAFIFSNSLDSMNDSAEKSGRILNFINEILISLKSPILFSENFVRKTAHFLEFFTLGALLFGYTCFFSKPNFRKSVYCSYIATLTAMTDETIQSFSQRGSMLLDVWLDSSAAVLALLLLFFFYRLRIKNPD